MGDSENQGSLFWGPYNKDPSILGTISGSPIFGNSHIVECAFLQWEVFPITIPTTLRVSGFRLGLSFGFQSLGFRGLGFRVQGL